MSNFKSPVLADNGKVPCGTYLDARLHNLITTFCNTHDIDFSKFIALASYNFYYSLTLKTTPNSRSFLKWIQLNIPSPPKEAQK